MLKRKEKAISFIAYKKMKNKKKTLIAVCTSVLLLSIIATASFFAIFKNSKRDTSDLTTGTVNVSLVETFTDYEGSSSGGSDSSGYGLEFATKTIYGKNVGNQPAYVRVQIFPIVEYMSNSGWKLCGGINANYVEYDISKSNWIDGNDGYFYYYKPIDKNGTTSTITIENLGLNLPDIVASTWEGYQLRVRMEVILDATQSTNDLYQLNWGLDSLPSGVQ